MNRGLLALVVVVLAACGGSSDESVGVSTTRPTLLPGTTTTQPPLSAPQATTTAVPVPTSTTTIATTSTTTTSTTTPPPVEVPVTNPAIDELQLAADGIGAAAFSAEPEGVISYLSSFLGEPTGDTGWIDPFEIGPCPGTELRLVSWGVLTLTFGNFSQVLEGRRHFFAYSYGREDQPGGEPAGLETFQGITAGSRLVDLLASYPTVVLNPSDDFTPPNFVINANFRGFLTGLADDSTVSVIFGGQGCGG